MLMLTRFIIRGVCWYFSTLKMKNLGFSSKRLNCYLCPLQNPL